MAMKKAIKSIVSLAATSAIAMATAGAGHAQPAASAVADDAKGSGLSEITVTAQRRSENQQRVPVAVTVISAAKLETRSTFGPLDLPQLAPGLNVEAFNGDATAIYVSIRGQSYTTGTIYSAVIPYLAEVPMIKLTEGQFFDLQNVQVLRGPQGTLFGRVTNGGAILLEPTRPDFHLNGYVTQKLGNYDLHTTSAAINLPIIDDVLAVRVAYERGRQDGYVHNIVNGKDLNDTHYDSGRISILFKPASAIENLTIVNYQKANENGADSRLYFVNQAAVIGELGGIFGPAGATAIAQELTATSQQQLARDSSHTALNADTFHRRQSLGIINRTTFQLADDVTLKNIFGYMRYKQFQGADYDGSTVEYLSLESNVIPGALANRQQFSDELQLQGTSLHGALDWTAGAYADESRDGGPSENNAYLFGLFDSVQVQFQTARSKALYGQAGYRLSGALAGVKLRGGLRYTGDSASGRGASYLSLIPAPGGADPIPHGQCLDDVSGLTGLISATPCVHQKTSKGTLTYTYGIDYQIDRKTLVYAKVSRGYRPGGFNFVPGSGTSPTYAPEFDLSREIGVKAEWSLAGMPVRTNLAGFYDSYSNIQRRISVAIDNQAYSAVVNTSRSTVKGIELEATIQPVSPVTLALRYSHAVSSNDLSGYTAAYIAAACPADPYTTAPDSSKACPLSKIARLPRDTADLDATLALPIPARDGKLSLTANYHYQASQASDDTNYINPDTFQPAYWFMNISATWAGVSGTPFDLSLFATNLTNHKYIASIGSVSEMGDLGIAQATYGPPRQYGAALTYRF